MMKKQFHKKLALSASIALALSVAGCNIFNPTEGVNISDDDAPALTYQGYLHYQKNEYSVARTYFEKAIAADSAYSDAWYGRAKAVLNMQPGLNIFELLSYAKTGDGADAVSKFTNMPDDQANQLSKGIDSVFYFIDPFIERERLGKTDGKVKFAHFSGSYSILKMAKSGLLLRSSAKLDITNILQFDGSNINVDINGILEMGENVTEGLDAMEDLVSALAEEPEQAYNLLSSVYPEAMENFTPAAVENALKATANGIEFTNKNLKDAGVGRATVFSAGNGFDDDADGCVDEEVMDGYDNDGDGEIDEDLRPEGDITLYDYKSLLEYYGGDYESISPYFVEHPNDRVASVHYTEETKYVDTDGNGAPAYLDSAEWTFVYSEHRDRVSEQNYRFQFAADLKWEPSPKGKEIYYYKEILRKDPLNPDYDLAWRKKHIGGCWNNYASEESPSYITWMESHRTRVEGEL